MSVAQRRDIAAIVAAASCLALPAAAAAAGVEASVVPDSVQLSAKAGAVLHVVVSNGTTEPLRRVVLQPLAAGAAGFELNPGPVRPRTIQPGSVATFAVRVQTAPPVLSKRVLTILVRHLSRSGGTVTRGATAASFTVEPVTPPDVSELASIDLKASLGSLRSGRQVPAYLFVANKSGETLHIGSVAVQTPDFLTATGGDEELELPPGVTERIDLQVKADARVRPGKHQLVVEVPIRVGDEDDVMLLTTTQETDVAVEGESGLLTALGVPAVFLVPGFLALAFAGLLWKLRLFRHSTDGGSFPVEAKTAEFWLLAISASLPLVFLWRALGFDLLDQYSRDDIGKAWAISLALGLVTYLIVVVPLYIWKGRRTPSRSDTPVDALRKLDRQGLGTLLPTRPYSVTAGATTLYVLQPPDIDRPATWFAPAVVLSWPAQIDAALYDKVTAASGPDGDAGELADVLSRVTEQQLKVGWDTTAVPGPLLIDKDKVGDLGPPGNIVTEAES